MRLVRFNGWAPLPFLFLFLSMLFAAWIASPEHPNLGPGIALGALVITGLWEGFVNGYLYK